MKSPLAVSEVRSQLLLFGIAVGILIVFYHVRFGLSILDPRYITWVIENTELGFGYFSFGFYRQQTLGFPLGKIDNYFYPLGVNIFTSDIPLLALIFKPLAGILPERFQYVGIWYVTCHLLQAWFAILLCERIGVKGFTRLLVVMFLIFSPVLLSRFIHPNLFCQWMILAGLYIYFLNPDETPVRRILFYQLLLFLVSGLEFAYMWAMIFGFSVALFLRLWLVDRKLTFKGVIFHFFLHNAILLVVWFVIGLISFGNMPDYSAEGWGAFTLNLNSLYNPMGTATLIPSLPFFPPQQLEGYNYLGAGMLLLTVVCILFFIRNAVNNIRIESNPWSIGTINIVPLLAFFLVSILFALSNTISINDQVIFRYPLSDMFAGVVNAFRSSGRFFWPVYYFIFVAACWYFTQLHFRRWITNTVLGICLFVQLYDIQSFLKPEYIHYDRTYFPPINNPIWEKLISSHDAILFFPGFRRSYLNFDDYRFFTYHAVNHNKKINLGYIARFDAARAGELMGKISSRVAREGLDENIVYVSSPPNLNALVIPMVNNDAWCFDVDGYLVFLKKTDAAKSLANFIVQNGGHDKTDSFASAFVPKPSMQKIDTIAVAGGKLGVYEVDKSDDHYYFKGWVFDANSPAPQEDSVSLIIESSSKQRWSAPLYSFATQDVAGFFNNPKVSNSGFGISLLTKNMKTGRYRTGFLFSNRRTKRQSFFWSDHFVEINRPVIPDSFALPVHIDGDVRFDINVINKDEDAGTVNVEGWAFVEGMKCSSCKQYLLLSSASATYRLAVSPVARPDVASFFKDSTRLYTGINLKFRERDLKKGGYTLGLLLLDTLTAKAYFSDTKMTINVGSDQFSSPMVLESTPTGRDSIVHHIDRMDEKDDSFAVEGWAFINNLPSVSSKTYVVLQSERNNYAFEPEELDRPDVKDYFKADYNITSSGFRLKIRRESLLPGDYKVCIMIENLKTGVRTLSPTQSKIKI